MSDKAEKARYEREQREHDAAINTEANLERIADSLERAVIALDSIATALSLQILKTTPTEPAMQSIKLCQNCGRPLEVPRPELVNWTCPHCGRTWCNIPKP